MWKTALVLLSAFSVCACQATTHIEPIEIDLSKRSPTQAPEPTPTPPSPSGRSSAAIPAVATPGPDLAPPGSRTGSPSPVPAAAAAASETYLYRATLVQAAPGKLLELIELYRSVFSESSRRGEEAPLWMRHSQGDRWDLLLLLPMASYAEYYRPERIARRQAGPSGTAINERLRELIAWQEDELVYGPPLSELRTRSAGAGFFHVEMFESLPGRLEDLHREREMENTYLKSLARPENLIFVRDQGAAWSLFTVGCYRNLKQYAESADIPESAQETAAKAAGFESASRIGPYLRTLIRQHHDTLAVAVK